MTEDFSFDFDDVRPRTWLDAFPWLRGTLEWRGEGQPWWQESIDDASAGVRRHIIAQISELAMERLTQWTIGQIFPGLSPDLDLRLLQLPARAANTLDRRGCTQAAALAAMTVDDMIRWRQVGAGTIDAILQALADASTTAATPTVISFSNAFETMAALPFDELRTPDWLHALNDDLTTVATWFATVGFSDQALLGAPLPAGTPHEIVKARQRLETLTADQVLGEDELELDIAGRFDDALRMLDPRAAQILAARMFADKPVTLDQLGLKYEVTRERIRQIEGKATGTMRGFISESGALGEVAEAARSLIGTIRPLDELLELIPALGRNVETVGQPAWRVLDRLDDAYQIEDEWCVVPTMTAAENITQTLLQERADKYGVARMDEFDLIESSHPEKQAELTAAWITHCGYIVDRNFVLTRTSSVNDYAAAILSIDGSPLSPQEIVDRFVFDRSPRSLGNALSGDDRFERVDRDRWALKEWGLDAYAGIRSVIREQVARSGGRVKLTDLVEHITSRYSVSGSSVVVYAGAAPFITKDGMVQLATEDQGARKAPERTRRLFRRPDGWAYRVRISNDHLRGSGSLAPHAIAAVLDLHAGETRQLHNPLGAQSVAWTGLQPQFGTIRRFLMAEDVAAGAEAFLILQDDATFSFELARDLIDDPLADALSLAGAPAVTDWEEARLALAQALRLPDASPVTSIIGGYRERGDDDIAELLTSIREYLETGNIPTEVKHRADVDDILDLL
ncbi:RNA polymerase, alpha chain C terminal domain [Friedmanniella luteola]|uniref:RNA polymerase, alpha chain C terminal domain n=1 Tax=Friedmanniella luteola TaxID=546871 RepID=A0A1H1ZN84_9ACTN|nr:sigma factor-like helix-turn-helix DNA-binding protein [Friedmanniella luteola]SDT34686.1 RNA polymerase, alpha chain C terminal domain [Friedmanniella luteola]